MIAIAIIVIASIPIHILWLKRRRLSLLPGIGTRWLYDSYLSKYKAEVVEQHPFSNEITIVRVRVDDPLSVRTVMRMSAKQFMSNAKPYGEKK